MKPKVVVNKPIPKEVEQFLREHCDVEKTEATGDDLLNILHDAEGLLTSGGSIDENLLNAAPKLKVVSNISVGYNNFDIDAMRKRNVIGTHTPYVLDDTVADLILALMLAAARRIAELDRYVKEGKWNSLVDEPLFAIDVHHATVGIIGMGRIGEAIAKRCRYGFDMNVLYNSRNRKEDIEQRVEMTYVPLDTLLKESDFVVLMTPLTKETRHLIGREQFKMMKKSAIFINGSRGATVDEEALIEALQTGEIRAAGLDVYTKEPIDPDNPLLKLENAVTVPHIGSATAKTRFDMAMLAANNLVKALRGEEPDYVVPELKDVVAKQD